MEFGHFIKFGNFKLACFQQVDKILITLLVAGINNTVYVRLLYGAVWVHKFTQNFLIGLSSVLGVACQYSIGNIVGNQDSIGLKFIQLCSIGNVTELLLQKFIIHNQSSQGLVDVRAVAEITSSKAPALGSCLNGKRVAQNRIDFSVIPCIVKGLNVALFIFYAVTFAVMLCQLIVERSCQKQGVLLAFLHFIGNDLA